MVKWKSLKRGRTLSKEIIVMVTRFQRLYGVLRPYKYKG